MATTIHKSQGSAYPIVVMPVMMNHYIMLQRNLIYTGITRAKEILVTVSYPELLKDSKTTQMVVEEKPPLWKKISKRQ